MLDLNDNDELKDLVKRKSKISRDPSKTTEYGDVVFRIGYLYYHKGYYKEALDEFEQALEIRKKLPLNVDIASTHRFLGETLCKLGNDFERAKHELDMYHSITFRIHDLVENQRSHTTLGNYYMTLAEDNYKGQRMNHLNSAYSHYLKSYDLLSDISDKRLVDSREFNLMKARTCLNCAFAMDEKRDLVICNEYLKSAIETCEANNFYEDLIRCYYIKCEQAKRKNKMEEMLKTTDWIIQTTVKTKDFIQQANDFTFVADIYLKIQNLEKAKVLLKQAYKLRKKCHLDAGIVRKLREVMIIIKAEKELNLIIDEDATESSENDLKLLKIYEKIGDSFCNIGMYELGLKNYFEQLMIAKKCLRSSSELAIIYASIGQTYQDLDKCHEALEYFELEMSTFSLNPESECKSLINIAHLKEKLHDEFDEIKRDYTKAYEKARDSQNAQLQYKTLNLLKDAQKSYGLSCNDTESKLNTLAQINKIKG
jgi:tetratricopeptide (TPR) repeat protein